MAGLIEDDDARRRSDNVDDADDCFLRYTVCACSREGEQGRADQGCTEGGDVSSAAIQFESGDRCPPLE